VYPTGNREDSSRGAQKNAVGAEAAVDSDPNGAVTARPGAVRPRSDPAEVSPLVTDPDRRSRYPALDGVRAVAVTAVLVFHGQPTWLPGGFLGVDVFFVLSGFLITTLLLVEFRRTGTIRLAAFWGRRARRLLPAMLLVLVAVVMAGRRLLPPEELNALRVDALATLGYVANWRMIFRGGDYFARTAPASPLQHTWSLGIEEQFYLAWPLLVIVALRWRRGTAGLLALCLGGTVAAAVLSAWLYRPGQDPARVYYGTDTRAGALLAGCAVAIVLTNRRPSARAGRVLTVAGGVAAAVIAVAIVSARGDLPLLYRGGLTTVAVAVAVWLAHLVTAPRGLTARTLSLPPVAWLGRISYGVYLWHWPLFAVLNGERTGLDGPVLFGVRLAASVLVAAAT
jgi:peptidoglycan/LPS O-acetylase OafA/YrhL